MSFTCVPSRLSSIARRIRQSQRRLLSVTAAVEETSAAASTSQRAVSPFTTIHSSLFEGCSCMDYSRGWAWQQYLLERRLAFRRQLPSGGDNDNDMLLLLEHSPVYTLGRGSDERHLIFLQEEKHEEERSRLSRRNRGEGSARLAFDKRWWEQGTLNLSRDEVVTSLCERATPVYAPNGTPIYRVERGGEVTFHGPGQLVVYPLIDLQRKPFKKDLHWYLRMVEEVIIETLRTYDIDGCRDDINTGVWVGTSKVAAVGVSSSRWITTHGFAINVNPDLEFFDTSNILPCGIDGRGVTSIFEILAERGDGPIPSVQEVAAVVVRKLQVVFGIEVVHGDYLE